MVIWITGISGSGKSTLSKLIYEKFKHDLPGLVLIDGDEVRELFGNSLGYKESDRYKQIERIQRIATMLDKQDLFVVVSALYAHPDLLAKNRENYSDYFEVYLDASVELVSKRDPKGLYAKAASGETQDVVGIDVAWHAPSNSNLRIRMDDNPRPEEALQDIVTAIPIFRELAELADTR